MHSRERYLCVAVVAIANIFCTLHARAKLPARLLLPMSVFSDAALQHNIEVLPE